jgi:stress-induced-phosphoprotein 1
MQQGINQVLREKQGGMGRGGMGGMGMPGPGGMFGPEAQAQLMKNPRIAKYFEDPTFKTKFEMAGKDPQFMMQLVQSDPRFMDVFKELTGIDLMDMQEKEMKRKEREEDEKKKRQAEEAKKKEEDEKKKKLDEEAKLPEEERLKLAGKREAEDLKAKGNEFYKKKDFENALKYYDLAIQKNPEELTYYTNKGAVFFEMKDYDQCIQVCDEGLELIKGGQYDYVKASKAMARKANALLQKGDFDASIEVYQKALLENQDHGIKMALQKAQKMKKDSDANAYINPTIAEEHRVKGNELFKEGKYP